MPADTKAMGLLIRMVPLMRREYGRSIDTGSFFGNHAYASEVLQDALRAKEERLVNYARELRFRLEELARGPVSGVRSTAAPADASSGPAPTSQPAADTEAPAGDDPKMPVPTRYLKSLR